MDSSHPRENRVEAAYRKEHDDQPVLLGTPEDVDRLVDDLLAGSLGYNGAFLYSRQRPRLPSGGFDHQVMVGAKGSLGMGLMRFSDEGGTWVTVQSADDVGIAASESEDGYVRYSFNGHASEFLDNSEVPVDAIRRAVKEFLATGGRRPTCVQWQVDR